MAEKNEKAIPMRELIGLTIWGQEKKNNRRISFGLYGNSYYVQIARPDDSGKFKDRKALFFGNSLIELSLAGACNHITRRLRKIDKGESLSDKEKENIVIFTGRQIKESTQLLEFGIFSKDDKNSPYIRITKKKKDNTDEKEWEDTFYFGNSSLYYKKTKDVEDKETYAFFANLAEIFRSCANRTNLTRDRYIAQILNESNSDNNESKSSSESKNSSNNNDDEDFPF